MFIKKRKQPNCCLKNPFYLLVKFPLELCVNWSNPLEIILEKFVP